MNSEPMKMTVDVHDLPFPTTQSASGDIEPLQQEFRTIIQSYCLVLNVLGQNGKFPTDKAVDFKTRPQTEDNTIRTDLAVRLKSRLLHAVTTYMARNDEDVTSVGLGLAESPDHQAFLLLGCRTNTVVSQTSPSEIGGPTSRNTPDNTLESETNGLDHVANIRQTGTEEPEPINHGSLWPDIRPPHTMNAFVKAFRAKHHSLASHLNTLADFLQEYSSTHEVERQCSLRTRFVRYVVASCVEKMYRRVDAPTSLAIIYGLHLIDDDQVRLFHTRYSATCEELLEKEPIFAEVLSLRSDHVRRILDEYPERELRGKAQQSNDGEGVAAAKPLPHLLNALESGRIETEALIEFHHLLVATLLAYGRALGAVRELAKGPSVAKHKDGIIWAERCLYILNFILTSTMILRHATALVKILPRDIGNPGLLEEYRKLTRFEKQSTNSNCNATTPAEAANVGVVNGESDSDEFREELRASSAMDLDMVYKYLLRLYIRPMRAVICMTSICTRRHLPRKLQIHLLITPAAELPDNKMQDWRVTFRNAFKSGIKHPVNLDEMVADAAIALGIAVRDYCSRTGEESRYDKILAPTYPELAKIEDMETHSPLSDIKQMTAGLATVILERLGSVPFCSVLHCEGAMASMMGNPSRVPDTGGLRELVKSMDDSIIGVSKRSCPVCSAVSEALRKESGHDSNCGGKKFDFRGNHPFLTPCELPPWLSVPVATKIVQLYKGKLRTALQELIDRRNAEKNESVIDPNEDSDYDSE